MSYTFVASVRESPAYSVHAFIRQYKAFRHLSLLSELLGNNDEAIYCLNRPHTGIYLPTMIWKDMYDFSPDSVLLVLASTHYDPDEYIRDYDEFVKEIQEDN